MVIVSSCLAGMKTVVDVTDNLNKEIRQMVARGEAIPVCPEQLGGLPTPRDMQEIQGGTGREVWEGTAMVITITGKDTTENFKRGARETLRLAQLVNAKKAILRAGSPSCGCGYIYDGTFTDTKREGDGVTAFLLKENGISVITEEDL